MLVYAYFSSFMIWYPSYKWSSIHFTDVYSFYILVLSRLVSGASIDTHEHEKAPETAVFNMLEPVSERRVAEEDLQHEVDYEDEDGDEDEYYYDDDEDDYEVSGDYVPRGMF